MSDTTLIFACVFLPQIVASNDQSTVTEWQKLQTYSEYIFSSWILSLTIIFLKGYVSFGLYGKIMVWSLKLFANLKHIGICGPWLMWTKGQIYNLRANIYVLPSTVLIALQFLATSFSKILMLILKKIKSRHVKLLLDFMFGMYQSMKVIISLLIKFVMFLWAAICVIKTLLFGTFVFLFDLVCMIPQFPNAILTFLKICGSFFVKLSKKFPKIPAIVFRGFGTAVKFFTIFSFQNWWVRDLHFIFIFLEDSLTIWMQGGRKVLWITLIFTMISHACRLFGEKDIRKREILFLLTIAGISSLSLGSVIHGIGYTNTVTFLLLLALDVKVFAKYILQSKFISIIQKTLIPCQVSRNFGRFIPPIIKHSINSGSFFLEVLKTILLYKATQME